MNEQLIEEAGPMPQVQNVGKGGADYFADVIPTPKHKQVRVQVGNWCADVDEGIAPLIEQIWLANIDTALSCQENQPGIVWIFFPSPTDARRFLSIVALYDWDADSIYQRVLGTDDHSIPDWSFDLVVDDLLDDQYPLRRRRWSFSVSIRFPITDIPLLMARLKEHNARRNRWAKQDVFAASCERLAAQEVERQAAGLTDTQLRAWIESELTDKEFRRAVLARVSPELRRRLGV
jgi:hypothetical protein